METSGITAALPAQDLGRAKAFYVDKVGLQALESGFLKARDGQVGLQVNWQKSGGHCPVSLNRSSPQADWSDAFDQVVEPLITEITCLRSHELRLFHLVSAYIDSPPGETTG